LYKGSNEQSILLGTLEKQRQLIVSNNAGASDRVFLYGWIAGNPIDGNGAHGARVAFGNTQDDRYQRTFAHELVHAFGRHHNDVEGINDGLDEVGWDVGARLVGNPAGNNETTRAKPITVPLSGPDFDVMTAGKLTNEAWINTVNYNYLLDHCTLVGFCPSFELSPQKKVAIVSGSFDADAAKPVTLDPVFRFPWKSQPSQNLEGRFVAELTDTKGVTTTRRFDLLTGRDSNDDQKVGGAFSVMVPVDPNAEIADLQIKSVNRTVRFAEMKRSKPPRIRINSPGPGAVLGRDERARHERRRDDREGETTEVRWTIDDPDTPDNLVRVEVAYSYDEGRSWVPIGVDIPGTDRALTFDSSEAPDSDGEGVVRVFVSDGLNTAYDDVTGLTLR
jgi:hypothetical protein